MPGVITFADAATEILAPWATPAQVHDAARALGDDADLDFGALGVAKKAKLIHVLVSQLKHLAVDQVVEVQRQLQTMLEAEPRGEWSLALGEAASLVELRNHLREVFTSQGLSWDRLFKLQAGIGALVRWLRESGATRATVRTGGKGASIELVTLPKEGLEAEAVAASPMILSLQPHVRDLAVTRRGAEIVVAFAV